MPIITVILLIVTPDLSLAANIGSDRSWVYTTTADFSDGEPKTELLAIRFGNSENAVKFKEEFESAQKHNLKFFKGDDVDEVVSAVKDLKVESEKTDAKETKVEAKVDAKEVKDVKLEAKTEVTESPKKEPETSK